MMVFGSEDVPFHKSILRFQPLISGLIKPLFLVGVVFMGVVFDGHET